jgi:hypothetical protein
MSLNQYSSAQNPCDVVHMDDEARAAVPVEKSATNGHHLRDLWKSCESIAES